MYSPSIRFIQIILLLIIAFSVVKGQTKYPFSITQYIENPKDLDHLETLKQVLKNPGLIELYTLLDGNGSFTSATGQRITLFAPTNEAFMSSGIDFENAPLMLNVIKYHIAPGKYIQEKKNIYIFFFRSNY